MYGGNSKTVNPGEMTPFPYSMLVKVDESDRRALDQDNRFFYPAYMGPYGWMGLDFTAATVDWDEVAELVIDSYCLGAPKRLVALVAQPG